MPETSLFLTTRSRNNIIPDLSRKKALAATFSDCSYTTQLSIHPSNQLIHPTHVCRNPAKLYLQKNSHNLSFGALQTVRRIDQ